MVLITDDETEKCFNVAYTSTTSVVFLVFFDVVEASQRDFHTCCCKRFQRALHTWIFWSWAVLEYLSFSSAQLHHHVM